MGVQALSTEKCVSREETCRTCGKTGRLARVCKSAPGTAAQRRQATEALPKACPKAVERTKVFEQIGYVETAMNFSISVRNKEGTTIEQLELSMLNILGKALGTSI